MKIQNLIWTQMHVKIKGEVIDSFQVKNGSVKKQEHILMGKRLKKNYSTYILHNPHCNIALD